MCSLASTRRASSSSNDIHLLLVERQQVVEVRSGEPRLGRLRDAEEHRVVGRNRPHVVLDAVEHALFLVVDAGEESGLVVVRLDAARRPLAEVARLRDQLFQHADVEAPRGAMPETMPTPPTAMLASLCAIRIVGLMPW